MLKVATAKEMQDIDRTTIKRYGVSGTVLMERAGLAVAKKINELFFEKSGVRSQESGVKKKITDNGKKKKFIILCGGGNNGGDGFVIARMLHNQGRDVSVFLAVKPDKLKGDALVNYKAAKKFGIRIFSVQKFLTDPLPLTPNSCLIVDALLGTGLSKDVKAPLSDVINKVNSMSLPVLAVDIPSGISSDTGQIMGSAVIAEYTVTFGLPKRGHLLFPGAEHTGKLFVEEIGFPGHLLESEKIRVYLPQKEDMLSFLPKRPAYSHKGTYGHVLLVAGSRGKTGAALMAAKAAMRTGAGLVTIGLPESLAGSFQSRVTEEMILPLPDKGNGTLSFDAGSEILSFTKKRANVLAIGPGLSADEEISRLVSKLIANSQIPLVIDADGLNAISDRTEVLKKKKAPVILTPHSGEMARLLQNSVISSQGSDISNRKSEESIRNKVEQDRLNSALSFARRTGTYLVLKGVPTVIATPEGEAFLNPTGNPGMATAGTGDVLLGMIAALLAQKLTPVDASILGVYMHGLAGDMVAESKGVHSLIASDIIKAISKVFKTLQKEGIRDKG